MKTELIGKRRSRFLQRTQAWFYRITDGEGQWYVNVEKEASHYVYWPLLRLTIPVYDRYSGYISGQGTGAIFPTYLSREEVLAAAKAYILESEAKA